MRRTKFTVILIITENIKSLFKVFLRQKISAALTLAIALVLVAILFSFLAFSPALSPFIYPLF